MYLLMFYPPKGDVRLYPVGVQLFLLISYFVLGNVYYTLNLLTVFCLFETFKMFYPPKGLCKADTQWGPYDVFPFYFGVGKGLWKFCFRPIIRLFETLKMFNPPEGTLQSRYRRSSNCFYFCLILC